MDKKTVALIVWLWVSTMMNAATIKNIERVKEKTKTETFWIFPKKEKELVPYTISDEEKQKILEKLWKENNKYKESLEKYDENSTRIILNNLWITDDQLIYTWPIIMSFANAEFLELKDNELTYIDYIQELPKLRKLDVSNNHIEWVEWAVFFSWCTSLEEIDFSDNHITWINWDVFANIAATIKKIIIRNNADATYPDLKLSELINLEILESLETLDVSNNKINKCSRFHDLPNLKELNISGNEITTLSWLKNLPSLESIDISNNLIWNVKLISSWGKDFTKSIVTWANASISALKGLSSLEQVTIDEVIIKNRTYFLYVDGANRLLLEGEKYINTWWKKWIKINRKEEPTVIPIY